MNEKRGEILIVQGGTYKLGEASVSSKGEKIFLLSDSRKGGGKGLAHLKRRRGNPDQSLKGIRLYRNMR